MGTNNYRGEISQISDDLFINYALALPDEELASTSGYFFKNPPMRYSNFIVQRGAKEQVEQTTVLSAIDPATGNKVKKPLATIQWSSNGSNQVYLGLITGYDPPSPLPESSAQLEPPYYPCYLSIASLSQPGIGHAHGTDKIDLHTNRITAWPSAVLTINLPDGETTENLALFLYQHKHVQEGAAPAPLQPEPVTFKPSDKGDNSIVIGAPGEDLQMGLYVIGRSVGETGQSRPQSA